MMKSIVLYPPSDTVCYFWIIDTRRTFDLAFRILITRTPYGYKSSTRIFLLVNVDYKQRSLVLNYSPRCTRYSPRGGNATTRDGIVHRYPLRGATSTSPILHLLRFRIILLCCGSWCDRCDIDIGDDCSYTVPKVCLNTTQYNTRQCRQLVMHQ